MRPTRFPTGFPALLLALSVVWLMTSVLVGCIPPSDRRPGLWLSGKASFFAPVAAAYSKKYRLDPPTPPDTAPPMRFWRVRPRPAGSRS